MSKKKNKFNLTSLVHKGYLKENQTLYFVSDPTKICTIFRQDFDGQYKVKITKGEDEVIQTVHGFATECLGTEPPDHASKWFRTDDGKTLYELWHAEDEIDQAA